MLTVKSLALSEETWEFCETEALALTPPSNESPTSRPKLTNGGALYLATLFGIDITENGVAWDRFYGTLFGTTVNAGQHIRAAILDPNTDHTYSAISGSIINTPEKRNRRDALRLAVAYGIAVSLGEIERVEACKRIGLYCFAEKGRLEEWLGYAADPLSIMVPPRKDLDARFQRDHRHDHDTAETFAGSLGSLNAALVVAEGFAKEEDPKTALPAKLAVRALRSLIEVKQG